MSLKMLKLSRCTWLLAGSDLVVIAKEHNWPSVRVRGLVTNPMTTSLRCVPYRLKAWQILTA